MSELIAEARVLIRPDTTKFTALLEAEVNAAVRAAKVAPVVVPVVSASAAGTQSAVAAQQELAASASTATTAITAETEALTKDTAAQIASADAVAGASAARKELNASAALQARQLGQLERGVGATALSLAGLRGATLAASGSFIAGAAGAIALGKAVQSAAQFQSELNVFRVTAGATADEMARVGAEAQALGRDISLPGVGAQDAAEAMTELSKAGLSVQDSLDGARGVLQLATAAAISNADATQLAATALNAFGLAGDQAVHVADVLTNAANASQGSISDIGLAFQQASAVAHQAGLSFEDTVSLLTQLQKAGIRGSDAGTSLRVSLIKLIAPSKQAQKVLDSLNVSLRDQQGNIRPDVFNRFAAAQADLSRKQQLANAAIVFGTDGLRTYSVVAERGLASLRNTRTELDRQGTAAEVAGARMSGLAGAAENLKNQLAALGLVVGQSLTPALTGAATTASEFVSGITSILGPALKAAGAVNDLRNSLADLTKIPGTDISLLASPFQIATKEISALGGVLSDTGTDLKVARLAVQGLVSDLNKVGGFTQVDQTLASLQKLADQFKGGDAQSQQFAKAIEGLIKKIQDAAAAADGNPINIKVNIPPEVLSGQVGADAAVATATGFNDQMRAGFGKLPGFLKDALDAAKPITTQEGSDHGKLFGAGFQAAVTPTVSTAVQSSLDLALAQASGNQDQELRVLIERRNRQQAFLDKVLARKASTPAEAKRNAQLATQAAQNVAATKQAIQSIFDARATATKQAADAAAAKTKKAADDAAKKIAAADQAVLDAFVPAQNRIDIQAANAQTAKQDLALQTAIANQASREIAQIDRLVKDKKTHDAEIAKRVQVLASAGAAITIDRQTIAANEAARQTARDALRQQDLENAALAAELTTSDKDDERVLRAQITFFANQAKRLGLATAAGKAAKGQALQFVKSLRDLLLARNKINDAAQEASRGPSAFDILTENAQIFQQTGGNLITGNQPFAGPTGFTADIAQFLHRGAQPTVTVQTKQDPSADAQSKAIDRSIQRLIDALNLNTQSRVGVGNGQSFTPINQTPGREGFGIGGNLALAWRWRQQVEADNG